MVDASIGPERIEDRAQLGNDDVALYQFWMGQDQVAAKQEDSWIKMGRRVVKRYRDERSTNYSSVHRFNILWSNVQTLIPTLYARTPKPDVQRRYLDQDPTGRLASTLLERALSYSLDQSDFDDVMLAVVQDRLLPGRGIARVMYIPHFGDPIPEPEVDPSSEEFEAAEDAASTVSNPGDNPEPLRKVEYEEIKVSYVYWEDYREGPARTYREVPWVRYRAYMTRDELIARFGRKKGRLVNLDFTPKGITETNEKEQVPPDLFKKGEVWEIWDRVKGRVVWLAPNTPDLILDDIADPLGLPDFYPSPDPLLATTTTDKRIPVPDFVEYQDQARELDTLTARIDILTRALKVAGIYPAAIKQPLQQLIGAGENILIPIEDWAAFTDKGGLAGAIEYVPIKQVADTLIQLYAARDKTKDLLYEITGIGDIMRGQTSPNETLGAQQLKANFSTRRIVPQQRQVAKFARDTIRLMAAIIAEHFSPQTISMITGYPQLDPVPPVPPMPVMQQPMMQTPVQPMQPQQPPPPDPAMQAYQQAVAAAQQVEQANAAKQKQFDDAVALIKQDGIRGFRLDIEADSTIAPDEMAEQQSRTDFMSKIVPLLENVMPLAQGNPAVGGMAKELVLFAVRGFRVARPLEEAIEKAFDAIGKLPPMPPKGQKTGPDPAIEQAKVAADVHDTQIKAQVQQQAIAQKAQQAETEAQIARERAAAENMHSQADLAMRGLELHQRTQLEQARMLKTEASSAQGLV